jgi:hypothetical protein
MSGKGWAPMFVSHGGTNNVWSGKIIDFANNPNTDQQRQGSYTGKYQNSTNCNCTNMTGNYVENSIFIANNPTACGNCVANGYLFGSPDSPLNEGNNFLFNHNTGQLSATCAGAGSSNCVQFGTETQGTDPQFQTCPANGADSWSYLLSTSSPALSAPTSFPAQGNNDRGIAWGSLGSGVHPHTCRRIAARCHRMAQRAEPPRE